MAFSSSEGKRLFEDWLIHFAKPYGFTRFLDIGAGAGAYGKAIRMFVGQNPPVVVDAVEVFEPYIIQHKLAETYDRIICEDILKVHKELSPYEVITIGDCVEHIERHKAIALMCSLRKKCRWLWAALPVKMPGKEWSRGYQQEAHEYEENPYNEHKYDWTAQEIIDQFKPLWLVPFIMTGTFLVEGDIK